MTFSDKPEPGMDYIALLLMFNLGLLAVGGWQLVKRDILDDPADFIMFSVSCLFILFPLAKSLRGSFDTEYRIDNDHLVIRKGKREETIPLGTIKSIEIVDSLWKSILFTNLGFANRITGLVRLVTVDKKYLLSPTHPLLFASHIRGLLSQNSFNIGTADPAASSPETNENSKQ